MEVITTIHTHTIVTHGGPWRCGRSCGAFDQILISEGTQCANCGAYTTDLGATWRDPDTREIINRR